MQKKMTQRRDYRGEAKRRGQLGPAGSMAGRAKRILAERDGLGRMNEEFIGDVVGKMFEPREKRMVEKREKKRELG